jgi:hypothetical protein
MLVCVQIIFNIAILVLLVIAGRYAKKQIETWNERAVIFFAYLDRADRKFDDLKNDLDGKFGPDLVAQLNAIFKLKEHPKNLVFGKDGQFHKINREY